MTNFRKIIRLFFSIIYITKSSKLTQLSEPLRSNKYLKNQFWTKNFGINLDDYNEPLKSFLLKISDEIIEKSFHDIEQYKIKSPTEALFTFKTDNIPVT